MRAFGASLAFALLLALPSCSEKGPGTEKPNQPPDTQVSNAPPQGGAGPAIVEIEWFGTDPDGEVVGFYFSWEDTTTWHYIVSSGSTFVLSATLCDSSESSDTPCSDTHTFWVKAVDDGGTHDPTPAYRSFVGVSVTPITTITRGPCERGYCGSVRSNMMFEWTAYDPDGGDVDSFFYKANVTEGTHSSVDTTWARVGADCTYVRFADVQATYLVTGIFNNFAVVAQDNSGARERVLVHGQNFCCFDVVRGQPAQVTIYGGILGTRDNQVSWWPWWTSCVGEIFQGVPLSFRWKADASSYGGEIIGFRYSLDDSLHWVEGPADFTRYPEDGGTFLPTAGNHAFCVEALDDLGTASSCCFKYYVEPGPGDVQSLLVVDDSEFSGIPAVYGDWRPGQADQVEGEFFERILQGYDYAEWDCLEQGREPPPISLVGRHRTVLWYVDDYDESRSALRELMQWGTRYLDSYVRAGGNLILAGYLPALSLDGDCRFNFGYTFRYDPVYCGPDQIDPISYSAFGLKELGIIGDDRFMGAISVDPGMYPSLPLGGAWPFPGRDYLYGVEVFGEDDYRTDINAIPIYEYDYRIEPNENPEEIASPMYCALVVDNSADPGRGSTAYFGWSLIWCDWDSVAVLMGKILRDVCDEPSAGR